MKTTTGKRNICIKPELYYSVTLHRHRRNQRIAQRKLAVIFLFPKAIR